MLNVIVVDGFSPEPHGQLHDELLLGKTLGIVFFRWHFAGLDVGLRVRLVNRQAGLAFADQKGSVEHVFNRARKAIGINNESIVMDRAIGRLQRSIQLNDSLACDILSRRR